MTIVKRLILTICLLNVTLALLLAPAYGKARSARFAVAGLSDDQAEAFFKRLKNRAASGDCGQLIPLVRLPIRVVANNQLMIISKKKTFYQYCEQIFNTKVRKAIDKQSFDSLFVNYQGVMVGNGELWFGLVTNTRGQRVIRIIAINNGGTEGIKAPKRPKTQ